MNLEVPHQVVFLDETWVFFNGIEFKIWKDSTSQSTKKGRMPTQSTSYIIVHAGTQNGFISGLSSSFVSGVKRGDYHGSINGENFEHWMLTQLLPSLEGPLLTAMDNTAQHNTELEKGPDNCLAAREDLLPSRGSFQS
jgi:hypothetical protein